MNDVAIGDRVELHAWGSTAALVVADPAGLPAAEGVLIRELAAFDVACSRFRSDSEITRLHTLAGSAVTVSPLLAEALTVALRAAQLTNGVVDPTVGSAVRALGYDRDLADVPRDAPGPVEAPKPAPGWWRVTWDPLSRRLLLPHGVELDLGATAKALAADRIAVQASEQAGCGVLVSLGGDVRVVGAAPVGGWRVGVGDDHEHAQNDPAATVTITVGGLATSGTTRRRWRRAGRDLHHIIDPRTGDVADSPWRTASVAAASCVDANTASTAAIVMGAHAPVWLEQCRLPARLVALDGRVVTTTGWPGPGGEELA